jgi:hypothetical protein
MLWIDLNQEPSKSCEQVLRTIFGFHPPAVEDALHESQVEIMKTLTVITILFMPLSFVVGFFGMNFFQPALPLPAWTSLPAFRHPGGDGSRSVRHVPMDAPPRVDVKREPSTLTYPRGVHGECTHSRYLPSHTTSRSPLAGLKPR